VASGDASPLASASIMTPASAIGSRGPPSLHRRLAFAAVTALLAMAACELALRAGGCVAVDRPDSLLGFQQDGPFQTVPVEGGVLLPSGSPREVAQPKRGRRVLLLGGSAALGAGYVPFTAMSGWLERWLRALDPAQPVEVIDMGIGGVASSQVLEVLAASLPEAEADLVVIYSGNNEMLESLVVQTLQEGDQRTQRARRLLWRLHLFRLVERLVPERPAYAEHSGHHPGGSIHTRAVILSERDRQAAREQYRRNLEDMARLARDAGVPLVLSTVSTNQRDYHDPGGSPEERDLFQQGRAAYDRGEHERAREAFSRAEERAARPSRADRNLRRLALEVAAETGATPCDVHGALAARAPAEVPGQDFFYDSCHANQQGHRLIAATMARCALEALGDDPGRVEEDDPQPAGGWSPWRVDHHAGRWDAQEQPDDGRAETAAANGHLAFAKQDVALAERHYRQALERGGHEGHLRVDLGLAALYQGRLGEAREQLVQAAALLPDDLDLRHYLHTTGAAPLEGAP
jgi:tetratricopeptide (TPR) repeat protein